MTSQIRHFGKDSDPRITHNPVFDRKRGCFYGLAIGDALGAAVEFKEPGSFNPVTGYRGFGPHSLAPGQWTDDTSMALALADSLGQSQSPELPHWDTKDQLKRYLEWYRTGKYSVTGYLFDIGTTTSGALNEFEATGSLENNDDDACAGNGSIMRLAPVPIAFAHYYSSRVNDLYELGVKSSKTTHACKMCAYTAGWMTVKLAALINREPKENVLSRRWWEEDLGLHMREHEASYIYDEGDRRDPRGTGFVLDSIHAALWAFRTTSSFEECVLKAVNLGDDADTTGAVAGQFAGAYYGYSGIPQSLIAGLDRKDMINQYLEPIL